MSEFEREPVPGLPQALPEGETIIWQGSPDTVAAGRHMMHAGKVAIYFALLVAWCLLPLAISDAPPRDALTAAVRVGSVGLVSIGLLSLLGWLISRTTVYTITNRRVVMRYGIALPLTLNLPFRAVKSADLKLYADGTGDIALHVTGEGRLGFLNLWPHVRAWRILDAEPALRGLGEAKRVAALLAEGLARQSAMQSGSAAFQESNSGAPVTAEAARSAMAA